MIKPIVFTHPDGSKLPLYFNDKEEPMNTVRMILSDGKDQLTKTVELTDIMIDDIGKGHSILILGRSMAITSLALDDTPKWTMSINFKKVSDKDNCMSKHEFVELLGRGWTLVK